MHLRILCLSRHIALAAGIAVANLAIAQNAANEANKTDADKPADGLAVLASIEQSTISAIDKADQSIVAIARVRKDQATNVRADQLLIPANFHWPTRRRIPTSFPPSSRAAWSYRLMD